MRTKRWSRGAVVLLAALVACAQKRDEALDATASDTSGRVVPAASVPPDTVAPIVGSNEKPPVDKVVGSAGNASSAGGARITGGPERKPTPPRNSGCGGTFVNVTVRATALSGSSLAQVATEVLAPVRADVGAPSLSPAIRAFRVAVHDPLDADRIVTRLRASPKVEVAERDGCEKMIDR